MKNVLKETTKNFEEKIINLENELTLKKNGLTEDKDIIHNLQVTNYELKNKYDVAMDYIKKKDAEVKELYFKTVSNEPVKISNEPVNKEASRPTSLFCSNVSKINIYIISKFKI